MSHSSWPLSHSGIGGSNHVAYYRLAGWFRDVCLLPEGPASSKSNCITPHYLPLSSQWHPAASSLHLHDGLEQPHENKTLRRLDKISCKPGWLHGASHYFQWALFLLHRVPPCICKLRLWIIQVKVAVFASAGKINAHLFVPHELCSWQVGLTQSKTMLLRGGLRLRYLSCHYQSHCKKY